MKTNHFMIFSIAAVLLVAAVIATPSAYSLATIVNATITNIMLESGGSNQASNFCCDNSGGCAGGQSINFPAYYGSCKVIQWALCASNSYGQYSALAQWKLNGVNITGKSASLNTSVGESLLFAINTTSILSLEATGCLACLSSAATKVSPGYYSAPNCFKAAEVLGFSNISRNYNITWTIPV